MDNQVPLNSPSVVYKQSIPTMLDSSIGCWGVHLMMIAQNFSKNVPTVISLSSVLLTHLRKKPLVPRYPPGTLI
ncbi:hypothetical protein J3R82DRAFT_2119 [Butyriboletus roseoflavus]|nr:hypothetical protein J3R82DRAFT_2119 [Butyriboletus roseoflavus]